MKNAKKIPGKELVWYIVAGFIALVGLTGIGFGIVGEHYQGLYEDNWILQHEMAWLKGWSGMGYRWWGLILVGVGLLIAVIALNVFAGKGEKDEERAARRAQRLKLEETIAAEAPVVEAKAEDKAEEKPLEKAE